MKKEKLHWLKQLEQYHLKRVKCILDGKVITEGLVYIEDRYLYVFQNKINGVQPYNTNCSQFGYKYSWCTSIDEQETIELLNIKKKSWWF